MEGIESESHSKTLPLPPQPITEAWLRQKHWSSWSPDTLKGESGGHFLPLTSHLTASLRANQNQLVSPPLLSRVILLKEIVLLLDGRANSTFKGLINTIYRYWNGGEGGWDLKPWASTLSLCGCYAMFADLGDKGQFPARSLPRDWETDQKTFNIIEPDFSASIKLR